MHAPSDNFAVKDFGPLQSRGQAGLDGEATIVRLGTEHAIVGVSRGGDAELARTAAFGAGGHDFADGVGDAGSADFVAAVTDAYRRYAAVAREVKKVIYFCLHRRHVDAEAIVINAFGVLR